LNVSAIRVYDVLVDEVDNGLFVGRLVHDRGEIRFVATIVMREGHELLVTGLHLQGDGANTLGASALRRAVRQLKVLLNVRRIVIEGARRTSGAGPGRIPKRITL
jgi:hypothetical protein